MRFGPYFLLLAACTFDGPANPANGADADVAVDARAQPACRTLSTYQSSVEIDIWLRIVTGGQAQDYPSAANACAADGARLAILLTNEDRAFADNLAPNDRTWIGMTRIAENDWRWADGTQASLEQPPWASGRPDGGEAQQCVTLTDQGVFDDEPCDGARDYLCECAP